MPSNATPTAPATCNDVRDTTTPRTLPAVADLAARGDLATMTAAGPVDLPASDTALTRYLDDALTVIDDIRYQASRDKHYAMGDTWQVFIRKMRVLTPQSYGTRCQRYLERWYGWTSVPASQDRGDAIDNGRYVEVKVSFITSSDPKVNLVQLRQYQDIAGYRVFAVLPDYTVVRFDLTKQQMADELTRCGELAHGTATAAAANPSVERSLRFYWTESDTTFVRWMNCYRSNAPVPT